MRNGEKIVSEGIKELRQYLGMFLRAFSQPLGYSRTRTHGLNRILQCRYADSWKNI